MHAHAVGPWLPQKYLSIEDPALFVIAERARQSIKAKIGDFYQRVLHFSITVGNNDYWENLKLALTEVGTTRYEEIPDVCIPKFFRNLSKKESVKNKNRIPGFIDILEPVLKNNLCKLLVWEKPISRKPFFALRSPTKIYRGMIV